MSTSEEILCVEYNLRPVDFGICFRRAVVRLDVLTPIAPPRASECPTFAVNYEVKLFLLTEPGKVDTECDETGLIESPSTPLSREIRTRTPPSPKTLIRPPRKVRHHFPAVYLPSLFTFRRRGPRKTPPSVRCIRIFICGKSGLNFGRRTPTSCYL